MRIQSGLLARIAKRAPLTGVGLAGFGPWLVLVGNTGVPVLKLSFVAMARDSQSLTGTGDRF